MFISLLDQNISTKLSVLVRIRPNARLFEETNSRLCVLNVKIKHVMIYTILYTLPIQCQGNVAFFLLLWGRW